MGDEASRLMDGNEDSDFQWTIIDSVHTYMALRASSGIAFLLLLVLPFCVAFLLLLLSAGTAVSTAGQQKKAS